MCEWEEGRGWLEKGGMRIYLGFLDGLCFCGWRLRGVRMKVFAVIFIHGLVWFGLCDAR